MSTKPRMSEVGKFFYILACILTFGGVWICKLIIQKAIVDAYD